jgi:stage II sporulation protein R
MKTNIKKIAHWLNKNKIDLLGAAVAGLAALFLFSAVAAARGTQNGLHNHIIRLHILAADNTEEEQALKLAVRDNIWFYMTELLTDAASVHDAAEIINQNLPQIKQHTEQILYNTNSNHQVQVRLAQNLPFPPTAYGTISLPQGSYKALQIIIGSGEGENWWCILFPAICLMDITQGQIAETTDPTKLVLQPRFRIAELWRSIFD